MHNITANGFSRRISKQKFTNWTNTQFAMTSLIDRSIDQSIECACILAWAIFWVDLFGGRMSSCIFFVLVFDWLIDWLMSVVQFVVVSNLLSNDLWQLVEVESSLKKSHLKTVSFFDFFYPSLSLITHWYVTICSPTDKSLQQTIFFINWIIYFVFRKTATSLTVKSKRLTVFPTKFRGAFFIPPNPSSPYQNELAGLRKQQPPGHWHL